MVEAVTSALRRLPPLLLLIALLVFPASGLAHRLDEYLQATLVVIEPDSVRLQINLTPGVEVADKVLALIDRDHDGVISKSEEAGYAELLKRDLIVRLDEHDVAIKLIASTFPELAELRAGLGIMQVEFSVTSTGLAAGAHKLTLENRHQSAVSVYLINAAKPKSGTVQITAQKRNQNQASGEIGFTIEPIATSAR